MKTVSIYSSHLHVNIFNVILNAVKQNISLQDKLVTKSVTRLDSLSFLKLSIS